jgi:biotin operon repressor
MAGVPEARQTKILELLEGQHTLSIQSLSDRLNVSVMTIHRDLNKLEEAGKVRKVHGGVMLVEVQPATGSVQRPLCAMCGSSGSDRTAFTLNLANGRQMHACCPHCGLLLLVQRGDVTSALARDFLYGRMVNVRQSHFVIGSSVRVCCSPSTICFESLVDATKFQHGFGGDVFDFGGAMAHTSEGHHH